MAKPKDNDKTQDAIDTLAGLAAIQAERRKHDAQTKDQTKPAQDILDKDK